MEVQSSPFEDVGDLADRSALIVGENADLDFLVDLKPLHVGPGSPLQYGTDF